MANPQGLVYQNVILLTERLVIRLLRPTDRSEWIRVKQENYDLFQYWEPLWDMDHLTYQGYNRYMKDVHHAFQSGNYFAFGVFLRDTSHLIGHVEVSNVLGWPKQCATIGYWMDKAHQSRGYMGESLKEILSWGFENLNLVKIDAGTMMDNHKSHHVLEKLGFQKEGESKSYIEIDGAYRDHYLWGITATSFAKKEMAPLKKETISNAIQP